MEVHIGATWRILLNLHVRRRCGLLSSYFDDQLLFFVTAAAAAITLSSGVERLAWRTQHRFPLAAQWLMKNGSCDLVIWVCLGNWRSATSLGVATSGECLRGWRPGVVDWGGGVLAGCSRGSNVRYHGHWIDRIAPQHHWLLPINCHFLRLRSALFWFYRVSCAI